MVERASFDAVVSDGPIKGGVAVTTSDTATIPETRALYVGVAGDVKVQHVDGTTPTYKAVPVGLWPWRVIQVFATGTAATNIIAEY